MDLRWLTAPEAEVAAAMATVRRESRPAWVPSRRPVLVHVNQCLLLWYLAISFVSIGVRVGSSEGGHVSASDVPSIVVTLVILALWLSGTFWLHRFAARPPSPRARLREWRQTLTALANGFEPRPSPVSTFSSLITGTGRGLREYPRFVAPGVEFGMLTGRGVDQRRRRSTEWHYLAVKLPAPLPHLVLDAASSGRLTTDLPAAFDRAQRLTLTPDVMASLIDDAAGFNVETLDRTLVFFSPTIADFTRLEPWLRIDALLGGVAARLAGRAERYRDDRVPGQSTPRVIRAIQYQLEHPGTRWVEPEPRIGADGRRLDRRDRGRGGW
ncbi:hypothetical protein [Subtercola boreus]|uniref:hypothetical protein n=1 Tax=Subtercola boreus TaxID=120213 RepID=UPI0011C06207|nr:hypothetical protein [Subtercola boreus]